MESWLCPYRARPQTSRVGKWVSRQSQVYDSPIYTYMQVYLSYRQSQVGYRQFINRENVYSAAIAPCIPPGREEGRGKEEGRREGRGSMIDKRGKRERGAEGYLPNLVDLGETFWGDFDSSWLQVEPNWPQICPNYVQVDFNLAHNP